MTSSRPFDLLIQGGRVIDPANQLDTFADVAIDKGRIVAVQPGMAASSAAKVHDATGLIVCPGLIDAHTHVADSMMPVSIEPDLAGLQSGVTTVIDAGSAGARTFAGFRKHIISRAQTRIRCFLNISSIGLVVTNELYLDPKMLNLKSASRVIRENRDLIIGVKARIQGVHETLDHDLDVMDKAVTVAEMLDLPIMMHWTNEPALLGRLRRGDIVTHPFSPAYYGPRCLDEQSKVRDTAWHMRDQGIAVDLGHGSAFDWQVAEAACEQGWLPDLLSTDMFSRYFGEQGVVQNLPAVMSKFLYLGLSLADVIQRVTEYPARVLRLENDLGSMGLGATADLTLLRLDAGRFEFIDSPKLQQCRVGNQKLHAVAAVKAGRLHVLNH